MVSALVYFPVAQASLRVNESGEVREEWETLQSLPPHGAQRKKILSLWLENQTHVKRLHSSLQKKKLSHELYHSLWQSFICWVHQELVWGGKMWHPNAAICLLQKDFCKLFHLGGCRGLPLITAEQGLSINPLRCVVCSSGGETDDKSKATPQKSEFLFVPLRKRTVQSFGIFFFCMGAILLLDKPLCAGSVLINKRGLAYNHFSSWGRGTQACSLCNYFNT